MRIARIVVWVVVGSVVAYFVWRTLAGLFGGESFDALRLSWPHLAGSVALLCVYYVMYAEGMALILGRLGSRVRLADAFALNFASNLGKYVPGGVWPVVGRYTLAPRMGIAREHALLSTVLETAFSVTAGTIVFVATLGTSAAEAMELAPWVPLAVVAASLVLVHPAIFGRIVGLGLRVARSETGAPHLPFLTVLGFVVYYAVSWVVVGLAFTLFVFGIVGDPPAGGAVLIGSYAAASVGGLLVLFAPGGIGVREAILGGLLAPSFGVALAGTVGIAARLWSTLVELALSGVALSIVARRRARPEAGSS